MYVMGAKTSRVYFTQTDLRKHCPAAETCSAQTSVCEHQLTTGNSTQRARKQRVRRPDAGALWLQPATRWQRARAFDFRFFALSRQTMNRESGDLVPSPSHTPLAQWQDSRCCWVSIVLSVKQGGSGSHSLCLPPERAPILYEEGGYRQEVPLQQFPPSGSGLGLLIPNTSGSLLHPPPNLKAGALWQVTQLALCSALECS